MEPNSLPWEYWMSVGQLIGMMTMVVGSKLRDYYDTKKQEKLASGLEDMAQDIDEDELGL